MRLHRKNPVKPHFYFGREGGKHRLTQFLEAGKKGDVLQRINVFH